MSNKALSIENSFTKKNILVLDGVWYIGKVWLSLILKHVPEVENICVLMLSCKDEIALKKFDSIYTNSRVFSYLKEKTETTSEEFNATKRICLK